MYAKNCTISNLFEALRRVNVKYEDEVIWNCEPTYTDHGIKFMLRVRTSRSKGHGFGFSGRYTSAACWHVHGDFFEKLFEVCPDAKVYSMGKLITRFEGNWQDFNRGSQMNPKFASEMCECN